MMRFVFILLVMVVAGCSSSTDVRVNTPPEISFAFSKLAVPKGLEVDIAVIASDEDDDPLTVQWEASSGTLNDSGQGQTVITWLPPASVGAHTITATVSDGKASKSATLSLQTGTLVNTDPVGPITSWTNLFSPYIIAVESVSEDVKFLISGGTLNIGPGVTVYIDNQNLEIDVWGTLEILGIESQPVYIKPNHRNPSSGYWIGILADVQGAQIGQLNLDYAHISYAKNNIRAEPRTNVDLMGCTLSHAKDRGIYFNSEGTLTIQDCDISQNEGHGIVIERLINTLEDLYVTIASSNIRYNDGSGVEINLQETVGQDAFISFTEDSITWNAFHGINLLRGAFPVITNCAIFFNDIFRVNNGFNVRFDPGFVGVKDSIDARGNFWGTAYDKEDSSEIAKLIYDRADNPALPKVRFVPWCDTYPCPPPPITSNSK